MSQQPSTPGPSFIRDAWNVFRRKGAREQWPYPWSYPPPGAIPVHQYAGIAMPAASSPQALVLEYTVPNGFTFILTGIIAEARTAGVFNSALAPGDGSLVWILDEEQPLGQTYPSGAAVTDFSQLTVPMGSFESGPWPLAAPFAFAARHTLRWKILNVSNTTAGAYVANGLFGWRIGEGEGL